MEEELTQEQKDDLFIEYLIHNGGNIEEASELSGHHRKYGTQLRKRLAKRIIEAANDYIATNAVKAASRMIKSIDGEMPNSTNLAAALALLDRVGIIKKDPTLENLAAKANIFILPAKDEHKEETE